MHKQIQHRNDDGITNLFNWKGENLLGFALIEVRDQIRKIFANVKLPTH
ncbi:NADAR family protein [Orenia metallireducens]|nr:NADAR family protein [Orenia metallireducens]